jgi:hypothetical protein
LTLKFPSAAEFLWQYVHSTPLAAAVAGIDDARRAALEHDFVSGSRAFMNDDGTVSDDVNVVLTTARK